MINKLKVALLVAMWLFSLGVANTQAYIFSSTWITIETTDVNNVSTSAVQGIATQFEVLKFIWLFILLSASWFVLTKILWIKIGWGQ